MIVLGLDPGSQFTGYGIVTRRGSSLTAGASGRIRLERGQPLPQRLARLSKEIDRLLEQHGPDAVAIESLFHGVNSRSLIVLAQTRGAIVARIACHDIPLIEFAPAEIKQAVTGNGRADKQQINKMVCMLLSLRDVGLASDEADALAIAITCAQRQRFDALIGRSI